MIYQPKNNTVAFNTFIKVEKKTKSTRKFSDLNLTNLKSSKQNIVAVYIFIETGPFSLNKFSSHMWLVRLIPLNTLKRPTSSIQYHTKVIFYNISFIWFCFDSIIQLNSLHQVINHNVDILKMLKNYENTQNIKIILSIKPGNLQCIII